MPDTASHPLANADQAARQQGSERRGGAVTQDCPLVPCQALEARVEGEDEQPLADIAVQLSKGDGSRLLGKTGPDGVVRFEGLAQERYSLSLYRLDEDAWELLDSVPLAAATDTDVACWQAPAAPDAAGSSTHPVVQGECVAKIAVHHGFLVETLWTHPDNADLAGLRTSPYVLAPGDRLQIPALRIRQVEVVAGKRYGLRRKGVPERLDLQFALDGMPRAGLDFHLVLRTLGGEVLKEQCGRTTADGRVCAWVPPDTCEAQVRLMQDGEVDDYVFAIGNLDPVAQDSGARARLDSLGFAAGLGDLAEPANLETAVLRFQASSGLQATGELDALTRAKLAEAYGQEAE